MNYDDTPIDTKKTLQKIRQEEWDQIEELVTKYKKQFELDCDKTQKEKSKEAAEELLTRFAPLFKKYVTLLKAGQIDFNDSETKSFVSSFINVDYLKKALRGKRQDAEQRSEIYKIFNFVKETYGSLPIEEITTDLQAIMLMMARRYKQVGKSFCGYIYNSYKYEVSRSIKKFVQNPLNIPYKNVLYEEYCQSCEDKEIADQLKENSYEDSMGIPDMSWITGESCSEVFSMLTPIERKILVKYYLEDWNDRQIADAFNIHINTINHRRRDAVEKIADKLGIDFEKIKRTRKSGKKAITPSNNS